MSKPDVAASPTCPLKTNQDCLHSHSSIFVYTETVQISDGKQQAISLKTEICLPQEILGASWGNMDEIAALCARYLNESSTSVFARLQGVDLATSQGAGGWDDELVRSVFSLVSSSLTSIRFSVRGI